MENFREYCFLPIPVAIIIGSPVYSADMNGTLKCFFDRIFCLAARPGLDVLELGVRLCIGSVRSMQEATKDMGIEPPAGITAVAFGE